MTLPLWGKLAPKVTDEGIATIDPHPAASHPPSPRGGNVIKLRKTKMISIPEMV